MKYNILYIAVVAILAMAWVKIGKAPLSAPPKIVSQLSKTVNLKFKVTATDLNSVEMALNEGRGPNNLFVVFDLSDKWNKGSFSLVMKGVSESRMLPARQGNKPDISRFQKDNEGKAVEFYSFDHELVQGEDGKSYLHMRYAGPDMPLIESLRIEKAFSMPRFISARFVNNGTLEMQPGNYALDAASRGFFIPVIIR